MESKYTDQELTDCGAKVLGWKLEEAKENRGLGYREAWWVDKAGKRTIDKRSFSPSTKIDQTLEVLDACVDKGILSGWFLSRVVKLKPERLFRCWDVFNDLIIDGKFMPVDCARKIMEVIKEVEDGWRDMSLL